MKKETKIIYTWYCVSCKVECALYHNLNEDVKAVLNYISDLHRHLSPKCESLVIKIKSIENENNNDPVQMVLPKV